MPTGKEMCEIIVKAMKLDNPDTPVTPEALWNASGRGELWHVFLLYDWAKDKLANEKATHKS
jgi:hypothetical protein